MTQSIYTQVSNADVVSCGKKGQIIKTEPIPLLRDKYLGEYKTALEKAKVRKNLGIADEMSLEWGNINGFVEHQGDLVNFIDQKLAYKLPEDLTNLEQSISDVETALNYALRFVSTFKGESEAIQDLRKQIQDVLDLIETTRGLLQIDINKNLEQILILSKSINDINDFVGNVDSRIDLLLTNSKTLYSPDGETAEVIISISDGNALTIDQGLYVKDYTGDINTLQSTQSVLQETVQLNSDNIAEMNSKINTTLETVDKYITDMDDNATAPTTVGGITSGTKVSDLKGKPLSEIVDMILFPTTVRNLVYPQLYYTSQGNVMTDMLVKVGTVNLNPTLVFVKNDAGNEVSRTEKLLFNEAPVEPSNYDKLGIYAYLGSVSYEAGEYLVDNKGQVTNKRIEAGTKDARVLITTTYPWYAGNESSTQEQQLVKFKTDSPEFVISMTGKAVIKLPGSTSIITSFKVDGGLGYLDVDLSGWEESTEIINDFPYKVWTKKDEYVSAMSHKIKFKLSE